MKKRIFSSKEGESLSLVLLLVLALVFVSILAICISVLIFDTNRSIQKELSAVPVGEKDNPIVEQSKKLDPQNVQVAMLSGVVTAIDENLVTVKASAYGQPEQEFTLALKTEDQDNIYKYQKTTANNEDSAVQPKKVQFAYENLEVGDLLTVSFPLGVPMKEISNGALEYDQIIVDDEYDASQAME